MKYAKLGVLLLTSMLSAPAMAQSLTIGAANDAISMDPQFTRAASNQNFLRHIFDRLVEPGRTGKTEPYLATSWENVDPTTWVVHLREGVSFHNGNAFTAEDVVFSLERAPNVPNSPASFAASVAELDTAEIVDDYTIRFTTKNPSPRFIEDIGYVFILDKETAEGTETADYNSGDAVIGTGPYKFVSWTPGDRLVMERYEDYWGEQPAYEDVTMRYIGNDAARIAALRSGEVDIIDQVPPVDVPALQGDSNVKLYSAPTYRIIYLAFNQNDDAPGITDLNGNALDENPFQDARVRQALNLMIDRGAIVERLLQGAGKPANQFVNEQSFGYNPFLDEITPDVDRAKQLLADAGYPEGFGIGVYSSNDRFPQDAELAQVLGQMFARGGMKVNEVSALPYSVYSKAAGNGEYPVFTFSYGNATAESLRGLLASLHTQSADGSVGTLNRFGYSNPEVDEALDAAAQEFDSAKSEELLFKAAELIHADAGFAPLYFQNLTWASRANVEFDAWSDERTFAFRAHPAN